MGGVVYEPAGDGAYEVRYGFLKSESYLFHIFTRFIFQKGTESTEFIIALDAALPHMATLGFADDVLFVE